MINDLLELNRIKELINIELNLFEDDIVKNEIEKYLIEPIKHLRSWDYSLTNEEFPCWSIALDENSGTIFLYSEYGFGPKCPWGIASTSQEYFGSDFCWYTKLKDCFIESYSASDLPIWCVEKASNDSFIELIATNLTTDKAFEISNVLSKTNPEFVYSVSYRN